MIDSTRDRDDGERGETTDGRGSEVGIGDIERVVFDEKNPIRADDHGGNRGVMGVEGANRLSLCFL